MAELLTDVAGTTYFPEEAKLVSNETFVLYLANAMQVLVPLLVCPATKIFPSDGCMTIAEGLSSTVPNAVHTTPPVPNVESKYPSELYLTR